MKTIHYFSPWLKSYKKYLPVWSQIEAALIAENEIFGFVPNSADIWVRDFMPVQRHDGEFVIYRYNPDYLQGKDSRYITNCRDAFLEIGGAEVLSSSISNHTNLVIDGGNIIKCTDRDGVDCVIMTAKVLYENPYLSHHEILFQLEELFNAEVIMIPWDTEDKCGHADGMVRSFGKGGILMNCYSDIDPKLGKTLEKALGDRFEIHAMKYDDKFRQNSWCHLNYLELSNSVLVPVASIASDKTALKQLEAFIGKKCIPISMAKIVNEGGAMHCISWSIDTAKLEEDKISFGHSLFAPQYH